jgi:hypothetical protein
MKIVLKVVAVIALTFLLARLAYSLDWVDAWFRGPRGMRFYYGLADFFKVRGSEDGERLIFNVVLGLSLVLSIVIVSSVSLCLPRVFRRKGASGSR